VDLCQLLDQFGRTANALEIAAVWKGKGDRSFCIMPLGLRAVVNLCFWQKRAGLAAGGIPVGFYAGFIG